MSANWLLFMWQCTTCSIFSCRSPVSSLCLISRLHGSYPSALDSSPQLASLPPLFSIISLWLSLFSFGASMLADTGRFAQASSQEN